MNTLTFIVTTIIKLPIGRGPRAKAMRKRHIESVLRACGMSKRRAYVWTRHIPWGGEIFAAHTPETDLLVKFLRAGVLGRGVPP